MSYKFEYETQGAASFLVYQKSETDIVDCMTMGMISNNKIEGVLPFIHVQVEDNTFFKYNVSSQNTLQQYFSGVVTKKRFLKVLESLLNCFIMSEEYMLEISSVVLDLSYIFVNPNTSETSVVVLPIIREETLPVDKFVRNLLFSIQFDQSEDCSYIAALISFLNSNQFLSIHAFRQLVQDLLKEKSNSFNHKAESQRSEALIEKKSENIPAAFTEVEKAIPNAIRTRHEEDTVQQAAVSMTAMAMPDAKSITDVDTVPKKEKRTLFGKKEKNHKRVMPEPPPYVRETQQVVMDRKAMPASEKKEKRTLFGKMQTQVKKTPAIAIPGATVPEIQIPAHQTEYCEVQKAGTSTSQNLIPTQQIPLKKHSVKTQDFGETVDLRTFSEETTVLTGTTVLVNPTSEKKFFIKRTQTRECFELKKEASKIGKDAIKNEISIQGNSAVSREHAVIYRLDQEFYVEDLKSTNGTYVNGVKLQPQVRSNPLRHGDKVRLGDEELEFIVQD